VVKRLGLASGTLLELSVDGEALRLERVASDDAAPDLPPTPEPYPVTAEWLLAEAKRLGGLANAPVDDWDWGPDRGSEIIYDDYNPRR